LRVVAFVIGVTGVLAWTDAVGRTTGGVTGCGGSDGVLTGAACGVVSISKGLLKVFVVGVVGAVIGAVSCKFSSCSRMATISMLPM